VFAECFVGSLSVERAARSREIVESLLFGQFSVKVYVTGVCQQLVELLLVGPMRPLDLAIELR